MPVSGAGSEITALYESLQAYACVRFVNIRAKTWKVFLN